MGGFSSSDLISLNQMSRDADKYLVTGKYRLTIVGVELEDEGFYECSMGEETHAAFLQVAGRCHHTENKLNHHYNNTSKNKS